MGKRQKPTHTERQTITHTATHSDRERDSHTYRVSLTLTLTQRDTGPSKQTNTDKQSKYTQMETHYTQNTERGRERERAIDTPTQTMCANSSLLFLIIYANYAKSLCETF